ncbi:hypothetical protein QQ045_018461 [Rhodiola kirilowii]
MAPVSIEDLRLGCGDHVHSFDLPPSVFQCTGLSVLTIRRINLHRPIAFRGFPNLVELVLLNVHIFGDVLEKIISSCPLEVLIIHSCSFYSGWVDPHKTAISAPNLRVLQVVCSYFGLKWSYLKYTPNLRVALFLIEEEANAIDCLEFNCFDILQSMPKIEVLTLNSLLHKVSRFSIAH